MKVAGQWASVLDGIHVEYLLVCLGVIWDLLIECVLEEMYSCMERKDS